MLRLVLENYPIKSVRDIAPLFGAFTAPRIMLAGKKVSLNHLEKEVLIPEFKDPRVHFAWPADLSMKSLQLITADGRAMPLQGVAVNAITTVTIGEQAAEIRRVP